MNVNIGYPTLDDVDFNQHFWAAINGKWILVMQSGFTVTENCRGDILIMHAREDIKKWAHCEPPIVSAEL